MSPYRNTKQNQTTLDKVLLASLCRGDNGSGNRGDDSLHERKMLQILVGWKQHLARHELDQNASQRPNVARKAPPAAQNDLRGSIVARRDNGRVMITLKRSGSKINQHNLRRVGNANAAATAS